MIKKLFIFLTLLLLFVFKSNAQLCSLAITSMPCIAGVGVTGVMTVTPCPGATYYQWQSNSGSNALWFNGNPGSLQTTTPSINLSFQLAQQFYEVCVTAYSANDSSNTVCDTIWGYVNVPVFSPTNNSISLPGTSSMYAVEYPTAGCPSQYIWYLTGDISFSNGSQITSGSGVGVNLNFGPNFTTGTLCVQATTNFGSQTDTICMIINAPVGLEENTSNITSINYQQSLNQITIQFDNSRTFENTIKIIDVTGREVLVQQFKSGNGNNAAILSTANLKKGIYFAEVNNTKNRKILKFLKSE